MPDKFYDPATDVPQPEGYTVWVCETDNAGRPIGTHHVSHHCGTAEEAKQAALQETAMDWGYDPEHAADQLHVLGVCLGNVHVMEWDW